jgi:hypothetical protein
VEQQRSICVTTKTPHHAYRYIIVGVPHWILSNYLIHVLNANYYTPLIFHTFKVLGMAPTTAKQWTVEGKTGFDALKLNEKAPVPQIGDKDVLVKGAFTLPCWSSFIANAQQSMPYL